ncbi:MAG: elongation factor G [Nitrospirae bacterium RIFCSPLOWO2_02_FULL_62_14]|nr:MAG: elongation factor G [Nitrospirae bacterium RIFCSPLOWO2_02_FULL_62_14]
MVTDAHADTIRNIAVVSSAGAGKTSLVEALLYTAGAIPAMGAVGNGSTVSDFEPEEIHRKVSVSTAAAHFPWKGVTFNLLDTPGAMSFLGEAELALHAVDGVLIVLGAASGMRTELEKLWGTIADLGLPCILFVNELDKERTVLETVLKACEDALEIRTVPVTIPIGLDGRLEGVVLVAEGAAYRPVAGSSKVLRGEVPADGAGAAGEARKKLVESAAETDDQLVEKYLAQGDLAEAEMLQGIKAGTCARKFVPVLCGSAVRNIGTAPLLDALAAYLPSPVEAARFRPVKGTDPHTGEEVRRTPAATEPFSAYVFKTLIDPFAGHLSYLRVMSGTLHADTPFFNASRRAKEKGGHLFTILGKKYAPVQQISAGDIAAVAKLKDTLTGDTVCDEKHPILFARVPLRKPVFSFALEPKAKADIEKVSVGLHKLVEEDPTLEFTRNPETKEMVLGGMGQLHVDVTFEKLRRKYGVDVDVHVPKIPYKETIRRMAQAQGKYKKQTGGHGQYGDCWLQVDPLPRGGGFEFVSKVVGGAIPRNFIPAVEKGVLEAMHEGGLARFPVVDVRVTVYDGSYHVVDSSEMAFKIAASMGFKKAMEQALPALLEPIMSVEVVTPDDVVGAVIGDLNARRGRIIGVTAKGHAEMIHAAVPLADMLTYAPMLNSISGGRATYGMEFSAYEEVPKELAARVIEEHRAAGHAVAL